MSKPIKRHPSLQPISREHHFGLLLSWKIRTGLKKQVAVARIKNYTNWFWENHLQAHFEFEENYMFPLLGNENKRIKRALKEHVRLKKLFTANNHIERNLMLIEEELIDHIRFEERVLFNEIQVVSTKTELDSIEKAHSETILDEWEDEFWVEK